jgi:hypothetical protein
MACYTVPTPTAPIYDKLVDFVRQWSPPKTPVRSSHVIHDFFKFNGGPVCVDFDELFNALEENGYKVDKELNTIWKFPETKK